MTGVLLLLGIVSSKLSARLGLPVLVLFLLVGMLAGSEGIGGIEFEDYRLSHAIGTVALAIILFDGGVNTSLTALRIAWKPAAMLGTMGVLVTAAIAGFAAALILGISWLEGLLLGSIVSSTDAAAVFSVLRNGGVGLPKRITAVLEVESASNDPMAIFMTIGCIELLLGQVTTGPGLLGLFVSQMLIGCLVGLAGGFTAVFVVNRIRLSAPGMYPVLVSAFCLLTFGLAARFGGSGFLAVYLAGLVIGNRPLVFQRGIRLFHEALAWLSQIVMFVVLGLLCFPSRLLDVAGKALLISAILIFIARPVAVLVSVFPFRFTSKELALISWVGLKGAVPITLAMFPLMLATEENPLQAGLLFDVVFFIVAVSAAIQGTLLAPVATWLGLRRPCDAEPPVTLEINSLRQVNGEIVDYAIGDDSRAAGRLVKDLALPEGAVIALIAREDQIIPPQGQTEIRAGDHVILVLRPGIQPLVSQIFGGRRDGGAVIVSGAIEFPLRPTTTVGDLRERYAFELDGPAARTLAEVMTHELGNLTPQVGELVRFGPVLLRIMRLADNQEIGLIGLSIVPGEAEPADPPGPAALKPDASEPAENEPALDEVAPPQAPVGETSSPREPAG